MFMEEVTEEQGPISGDLFLFPANHSHLSAHHCSSQLLRLSMWLIALLDIVVASLALPSNAFLAACAFFARPIPFRIRRSLSAIALNFAFLAGIVLVKKCFWVYSALSSSAPCAPLLSSVGCKLQEFPVVFVYLHSLALPLAFAAQTAIAQWRAMREERKRRAAQQLQHRVAAEQQRRRRSRNNNNNPVVYVPPPQHRSASPTHAAEQRLSLNWACSAHQMALLLLCLTLAFLFTALDEEPVRRKVLANCSLPLAIRQKELLFVLMTLMLLSQLAQTLIWHTTPVAVPEKNKKKQRPSLMSYLVLSFRDLFLVEATCWSLVALLTGFALFHQFVLTKPCGKCTRLVVELSFTTIPLVLSLLHPVLSFLVIAPISYSAQRLCPFLGAVLTPQEPATPPLPRVVPTVRILITEH